MSLSQRESIVELPKEKFGPLLRVIPDTPWTTTARQALQNRKASVYVDLPDNPHSVVVSVRGGDDPGDHDQAYLQGHCGSETLRAYVSSVSRTTEFVVDEELTPMVLELHPNATPRDAICCWFEDLLAPPEVADRVPVRRLRATDADAAQALIPPWAFRTFETPSDMIRGGGCFATALNGKIASIAYVPDQSIKYARVAVATAEPFRRKGYAFAALRQLIQHVTNDGRLICALVPRRSAPAVHLALKLGFPKKALLRTYKVTPGADAPAVADAASSAEDAPADSSSSSVQTQG